MEKQSRGFRLCTRHNPQHQTTGTRRVFAIKAARRGQRCCARNVTTLINSAHLPWLYVCRERALHAHKCDEWPLSHERPPPSLSHPRQRTKKIHATECIYTSAPVPARGVDLIFLPSSLKSHVKYRACVPIAVEREFQVSSPQK